jgi:phage terminase large subunit
MDNTVYFNPVFKPVNECRRRYRILKGSAGSGKSVNIAQDYILKLSDPQYKGANLLVVRKIDESNRDSTFAELSSAISKIFGASASIYWKINNTTLRMTCLLTGNSIIFRGMANSKQREKVKSITFKHGKLIWIWCEEATELDEQDVEILDDRLRGYLPNKNLYYQITLTFNPVSKSHWIKRKYFDYQDDETFTHQSTYLTNLFVDDGYRKRMARRKILDPEGYQIYGLGEWGETGGLILSNYMIEPSDIDYNHYDKVLLAQDFGFNHANAILKIGFKDVTTTGGDLFIFQELYGFEKDTAEWITEADKIKLDKSLLMWCDSAEPDRIKMWRKAGYKAKAVSKNNHSVKAQIDILKRLKIHIDPSCKNVIKEIQSWKWKKDKTSGLYLDEPVEIMDDAMACLRYGIEDIRQGANDVQASYVDY